MHDINAYGEEHPLNKCDISEIVINVEAILWLYRRGSSHESRSKAFS